MIQSITAAVLFKAPPPEFIKTGLHTHMMDDRKPSQAALPVMHNKLRQRMGNERKVVNAINAGVKTLPDIALATGIKLVTTKVTLGRLNAAGRLDYTVSINGKHIYSAARHA